MLHFLFPGLTARGRVCNNITRKVLSGGDGSIAEM